MAQAIAGLGSSILGGIFGGKGQSAAANAQAKAYTKALSQQAGQFAVTQGNLNPYIHAGQQDLGAFQDLIGQGGSTGQATGISPADQVKYLVANTTGQSHNAITQYLAANPNATPEQQLAAASSLADVNERARWQQYVTAAGPYSPGGTAISANDAQQHAIDALKASPAFTALYNTGADTIDQNAAATGGLRGGNTQNSLAQFGSGLLAQVIQQQLANLGGIASGGANSAMGLGQISQNNSNAQSNLYGQLGGVQGVQAAAGDNMISGIFNKLASSLNPGGSLGNFFGGGGNNNSVSQYGNNAINNMGLFPMSLR